MIGAIISPKNAYKIHLNIIKKEDLIDNSWTITDVVTRRSPYGWEKVFQGALLEIKDIDEIIEQDKKINDRYYPDTKNLFKAFELTPLRSVKVVIMGQDPYHGMNHDKTPQAQGLSFSVKKGTKVPSSLKNIYKELKRSLGDNFTEPNHGDLTGWARQGVLLLNSCLTVRPGDPGCHKELWYGFIKKVVNAILDQNPDCIFVLWGRKAQNVKKILGESATVLESSHPSGFSAHRGFIGCDHFLTINELLREKGKTEIDWNRL